MATARATNECVRLCPSPIRFTEPIYTAAAFEWSPNIRRCTDAKQFRVPNSGVSRAEAAVEKGIAKQFPYPLVGAVLSKCGQVGEEDADQSMVAELLQQDMISSRSARPMPPIGASRTAVGCGSPALRALPRPR